MGTGGADNQYVPGPVPRGYGGQPQSPPPQQAQGLEGGNVQSMRSSRPELDYVLNLALRIATLLLALISVAVIASAEYNSSTTDYDTGITSPDDIKALSARPYKFLVATAVIVMAYELAVVQVILLLVAKGQSKPVTATFWATLLTFAFDHVLGYLMFAAASSGATEADLFRHGGVGIQCDFVGQWCTQVESGVAMTYLAFATLAVSVLLSGFTFARHTITYLASKRASSAAGVGV